MQLTRLLSQRAPVLVRRVFNHVNQGTPASTGPVPGTSETAVTDPVDHFPRYRDLLKRVGRCLAFGCNPQQTAEAAALVRTIVNDGILIEMGRSQCSPKPSLVYKQVLQRGDNTATGKLMWRTAKHFLDHVVDTATIHKSLLEAIRSNSPNRSFGGLSVIGSQLKLRPVRLPLTHHHCVPDTLADDDNRAAMWDMEAQRSVIADATIQTVTKIASTHPDAKRYLAVALKRASQLGRDPDTQDLMRQKGIAILSAVQKLENETWNRDDAVEDLGSAPSA
ncbi:hypothetical protein CSUB01_08168 [Colletotrichum sublineola]|uniref:Uncharacterized protein n=1 Tax=Colletotrichum sublineola TaxID=1173701 RepID=A0A066XDX8_COLSU|nr:hypothetical protein CSUB01_08168 [Colletotrichum sublineola]